MITWPPSAWSENSFHLLSHPFLCDDRLATIVPNAAPSTPQYAAIEPPPGAGDSLAVSAANFVRVISTSFLASVCCNLYSIIFFCGSKGPNSSRPKDLIAILTSSASPTPTLRSCFCRKYLPASSMACSGTRPTSSLPVTRIPLAAARSHAVSNTTCSGVTFILVRLMDICATPYSSINQPMAFTLFSRPGSHMASPLSFFAILPLASFFCLPFSLISNATALARRVDVVFRFTL